LMRLTLGAVCGDFFWNVHTITDWLSIKQPP
jgi:hypothetical protein